MSAGSRYFLAVIDEAAEFYLTEGKEGGLVVAEAAKTDLSEARSRGVGRVCIIKQGDNFSVFDGFGDLVSTVGTEAEAEDNLFAFGYRTVECTSRLYRCAGMYGPSAHQLLLMCQHDANGLLDLKDDRD